MALYSKSKEAVLKSLSTNPETGLSLAQAEELIKTHGENRLKEKKKKSMLQRFFDQFKDVMILILIAAAKFPRTLL